MILYTYNTCILWNTDLWVQLNWPVSHKYELIIFALFLKWISSLFNSVLSKFFYLKCKFWYFIKF